MEKHARIFESTKLNKQILLYRSYDTDEEQDQLVVRFLVSSASVEVKIGYSSYKKAMEYLQKATVELLEQLIESVLPAEVLNEEEE